VIIIDVKNLDSLSGVTNRRRGGKEENEYRGCYMWEIILPAIITFMAGWEVRKIIDHKSVQSEKLEKPEMMWFNEKKSRWDRITHMHLCVADRVVVEIPVKLVEERREE
jgi:hypothetical protein